MKKSKKESEKQTQKPTKAKKIGSTVLTVILVLFLALTVYLFVQMKTAKRPNFFGYGVYTVVSGSMVPTLEIGDVIIVEKVDAEKLRKGDIITFIGRGELAGKVVTHRIISEGVEDGKITTCGDANYGIADKTPIGPSDVLGRYVKTSVVLSLAYKTFRSKVGFALIVFIPLLILLIVQFVNFLYACRMEKKGKNKEEVSPETAVKEKEDEIRRKAIEEYLESQKRLEEAEKQNKK